MIANRFLSLFLLLIQCFLEPIFRLIFSPTWDNFFIINRLIKSKCVCIFKIYVHTYIVLNYYYMYSLHRLYHIIPFKPRMRKSFPQTVNHTGTDILPLPNLIYKLSQKGTTLGFRAKNGLPLLTTNRWRWQPLGWCHLHLGMNLKQSFPSWNLQIIINLIFKSGMYL